MKKRAAGLLAVLAIAGAVGVTVNAALAAPKVAAPTITSGPPAATQATTATFSWTHSSPQAVFRCRLDGGLPAECGRGKAGTVSYPDLGEGRHTFEVTATVNNTTSSPATRSWAVDRTPPPIPGISRDPSADEMKVVQFKLTSTESGVSFECSMDGTAFAACGQNPNYKDLAAGAHCFRARAVDAAGNRSDGAHPLAEHCWTVTGKQLFGITGGPAAAFSPGREQRLNLTVSNPNAFAIRIKTVEVAVNGVTGCGADNFSTVGFAGDLLLEGKATSTLSALGAEMTSLPLLKMENKNSNQDGCKSQSFTLTYTGTATK